MKYTFTDSQARDYVIDGANIHCEPGESYDLDLDPSDGRFTPLGAPTAAPVVDSAPASTETEQGDA